MISSEEQLFAILATLEECRASLVAIGNSETAHLVSVATLQVRMKLNGIGEDELIALCEAMVPQPSEPAAKGLRSGQSAS